ncbi:MAG: hypothetical protein IT360_23965 [Gemmatimonadaceae bacterium]|nr:hypothetical protein [Gemmatimonadaceae bacterium]
MAPRFVVGLTEVETARLLEVTLRTVQRDWARARAGLYRPRHEEETST